MGARDTISYKKAVQALNYFAQKKDGTINKMKAIKLVYFADRLHMRKYGRPIVGDDYWAMKLGPVGSCTKRVAELDTPPTVSAYIKRYIQPGDDRKQSLISKKPVDVSLFSNTDLECLDMVYIALGDRDQFELAELSHTYPEWKKHEQELRDGKKRVHMDYADFFSGAQKGDVLFDQKKTDLALAQEIFQEREEVESFFTQ
ncbi:MAG: Panacea domain-containing protein [bacterium]|nr:Panacea domain-containing protein [bacterium]